MPCSIIIIVLSTGMISDGTGKIAGHEKLMTTCYSHFETADFSQYPEYLIDLVAGFFEK